MTVVSCYGKSQSSAMRTAAFSLSYDEIVAVPCCCFVGRLVGLAGSPSVATVPTPPPSVPPVADSSVYMMNRAFRCQMND